MTDQLTPWYDPKVDGQPVRVGWYKRKYQAKWREQYPDFWDGEKWWLGMWGDHAHSGIEAHTQGRSWRGLTEPNEEKQ